LIPRCLVAAAAYEPINGRCRQRFAHMPPTLPMLSKMQTERSDIDAPILSVMPLRRWKRAYAAPALRLLYAARFH